MMIEYDRYAKEFSESRAKNSLNKLVEEPAVKPYLKAVKSKIILDVGCGDGSYCEYLARKGAKVYGIEISKELLNIAKHKCAKLNVDLKQGTAEKLPYQNNYFDVIICNLVTEYLPTLKNIFKEFARVLKKNGRVIISVDHPFISACESKKIDNRKERILVDYFARRKRHYTWFDKKIKVFSHTLEDYFKEFKRNNFLVEELKEPTAINKAKKQNPQLYKRTRIYPSILVFKLKKIK